MKLNLTTGQWFAISIGVLSATAGATAQLVPVFGDVVAHSIVSAANLIMTVFVAPVMFVLTGQTSQVKAVAAMPGVAGITVNAQANQTLAQAAVSNDPALAKVEATPAAEAQVNQIAKGA